MKKQSIFGVLLLALFFFGCRKKNSNQSGAPSTYVDFVINISNPSYSNLNVTGGWIYYPDGVKGIIIFRKSVSEFMAYERNCTYQPSNGCAVQVQLSGVTAIDSCCGSKFLLSDGSVYAGPATLQLTRYQTTFDGASSVHVFN